jgi:hypothetical protein
VTQLFDVFSPESNGNFYHFNRILDALLTRLPVEVTEFILSKGLLWRMFDYLHESAIVEIFANVMCCGFHKQSESINFYKSLVRADLFGELGDRLYGDKAHPGNALDIAEFLNKVFEKLSMIEVSGVLFISMCRTSDFIDGLFGVISDPEAKSPVLQRQACAMVARDLLVRSGEKLFDQTDFGAKPMPNMLAGVFDKLHDFSARYVSKVLEVFVLADEKRKPDKPRQYSAYLVKRPLGMLRLLMVDVVVDLLTNDPALLDEVPPFAWRVLSTWFLEHSHNSLYQGLFMRAVRQAIMVNHETSLRILFSKYKFLTKMLAHYESPELSDARGFILLLLNTMRLKADLLEPSSYLRHFLTSHDLWRQFVPTLRAHTLIQTRKFADMADEFMLDDDDEDDEDDEGIDLGSAYARSLGFEEEHPWIEPGSATDVALNGPSSSTDVSAEAEPSSAQQGDDESDESQQLTKSQRRRRRRSRGTQLKEKQEKREEAKEQQELGPPQESPDWWKDMVSDIGPDGPDGSSGDDNGGDSKGEGESADWWKEITDEIEQAASGN